LTDFGKLRRGSEIFVIFSDAVDLRQGPLTYKLINKSMIYILSSHIIKHDNVEDDCSGD